MAINNDTLIEKLQGSYTFLMQVNDEIVDVYIMKHVLPIGKKEGDSDYIWMVNEWKLWGAIPKGYSLGEVKKEIRSTTPEDLINSKIVDDVAGNYLQI